MSAVLRKAWKLFRRVSDFSWATVLRLAWAVVRSRIRVHYSKAVGVTAEGTPRQAKLKQLSIYRPEYVMLNLVRELGNKFDNNAIQITASINDGCSYTVGYVKRELAFTLAPQMDCGKQVIAMLECITGVGTKGLFGLNYAYMVI